MRQESGNEMNNELKKSDTNDEKIKYSFFQIKKQFYLLTSFINNQKNHILDENKSVQSSEKKKTKITVM